MRRKHFIAFSLVVALLLACNFGGVFSFLNHWAFDQFVRIGQGEPVSPEVVAIRVQPNDDLEALVSKVQEINYKSLTLLMLNQSGTLTSYVFSPEAKDGLQFKSEVRPPDSLTWRGPENVDKLSLKLEPTLGRPVKVNSNAWLDFTHKDQDIRQIEAHTILNHDLPSDWFEDKIIIVGDHFASQTRFFSTPIHQGSNSLTALSREMLLIDTAYRNGWVNHLPSYYPLILAFLIITASIITYIITPFIRFKLVTLVLLVGVMLATFALLKFGHIWFPPAAPLFAIACTGLILYLASYREGKETLSDLLFNVVNHPTKAVLVYSPNGEQRYLTNTSIEFLKQFDIKPVGLNLGSLLAELTALVPSECKYVLEIASSDTFKAKVCTPSDENYEIKVGPFVKAGTKRTDYLVTINEVIEDTVEKTNSETEKKEVTY